MPNSSLLTGDSWAHVKIAIVSSRGNCCYLVTVFGICTSTSDSERAPRNLRPYV